MNFIEENLLNVMLQAPAKEIDNMVPQTTDERAKFLEIHVDDYNHEIDYFRIIAKLRRRWAQTMIMEAMGYRGDKP